MECEICGAASIGERCWRCQLDDLRTCSGYWDLIDAEEPTFEDFDEIDENKIVRKF